jgi:hypothetical protein
MSACGKVSPDDAGVDANIDVAAEAQIDVVADCMPSGSYCADGFVSLVDKCCSHGCSVSAQSDGAPLCN